MFFSSYNLNILQIPWSLFETFIRLIMKKDKEMFLYGSQVKGCSTP